MKIKDKEWDSVVVREEELSSSDVTGLIVCTGDFVPQHKPYPQMSERAKEEASYGFFERLFRGRRAFRRHTKETERWHEENNTLKDALKATTSALYVAVTFRFCDFVTLNLNNEAKTVLITMHKAVGPFVINASMELAYKMMIESKPSDISFSVLMMGELLNEEQNPPLQ